MVTNQFGFKLLLKDFIGSSLLGLLIFFGITFLGFVKNDNIHFDWGILFISIIVSASPVVSPLIHRKSRIIFYSDGEIEGYDFEKNQLVRFKASDIIEFGKKKAEERMNPRLHFSNVDHFYIQTRIGTVKSYIRSPEEKDLMNLLSRVLGK